MKRIAAALPTIILIYLDDAGYGDFGFTGHPTIRTPQIDRLAREGVVANQYYSVSPACTASRYAVLTGKYPNRSGFDWVLGPTSPRYLHPKETTIAELLSSAGYETAIMGKWHLGNPNSSNQSSPDAFPTQHGFDRWFGIPYSNDMRPKGWPDLPLYDARKGKSPRIVDINPATSMLQKRLTREAVSFLSSDSGKPKFLYFANPLPHVPLDASPEFFGRSLRGVYGDVMEEVDWSVGQIVDAVKDEDAIVIVTSDNGPWILKGVEGGSSGLFRDGKGSTWEGGVRVPLIVWNPKRVRAGSKFDSPVASVDILPSVVKWIGGSDSPEVDGKDFSAILARNKAMPARTIGLYGIGNKLAAVRRGPWKLHLSTYSQIGATYFTDPAPLLFNVQLDPSETRNVARSFPNVVAELRAEAALLDANVNSYWTAP